MTSHSKTNRVRRCRPLLGTFVELSATGLEATSLARAVGAAFGRIEKVQRLTPSMPTADSYSNL